MAVAVFVTSLTHFVLTPSLYGWTSDTLVKVQPEDQAQIAAEVDQVSREIAADAPGAPVSWGITGQIQLDHAVVPVLGLRSVQGPSLAQVEAGRAPNGPNEVALGRTTLDRLGLGIGDTVTGRLDLTGPPVDLSVVGEVVIPEVGTYTGADNAELGSGAVVDAAAVTHSTGTAMVVADLGGRRAGVIDRLQSAHAHDIEVGALILKTDPARPVDVVSLDAARPTPVAWRRSWPSSRR